MACVFVLDGPGKGKTVVLYSWVQTTQGVMSQLFILLKVMFLFGTPPGRYGTDELLGRL